MKNEILRNMDHVTQVGTTTPFLTSLLPPPTGEISTNNPKDSLFSHLQSILQANLMQRVWFYPTEYISFCIYYCMQCINYKLYRFFQEKNH